MAGLKEHAYALVAPFWAFGTVPWETSCAIPGKFIATQQHMLHLASPTNVPFLGSLSYCTAKHSPREAGTPATSVRTCSSSTSTLPPRTVASSSVFWHLAQLVAGCSGPLGEMLLGVGSRTWPSFFDGVERESTEMILVGIPYVQVTFHNHVTFVPA